MVDPTSFPTLAESLADSARNWGNAVGRTREQVASNMWEHLVDHTAWFLPNNGQNNINTYANTPEPGLTMERMGELYDQTVMANNPITFHAPEPNGLLGLSEEELAMFNAPPPTHTNWNTHTYNWRNQNYTMSVSLDDVNAGDTVVKFDTGHHPKKKRKVATNFGDYLRDKGVL